MKNWFIVVAFVCLFAFGCKCKSPVEDPATGGGTTQTTSTPSFSLAVSEYPSWSVFLVADMQGLIDGKEGAQGTVEKKWGVDVVLKEADYDTCLTLFGSGTVDASCQTNMDSLAPALGRPSTAILPTSTSVGADACIVVGINSIEDLKGKTTYGLEKSVAQYAFERGLEEKGQNPSDFPFKNMDPGAAAQAMQTGQANIESIQVWNPFVLQTQRTREGATVLFDSSLIPEEIIDMVVIGKDSLSKPGGEAFACCVIDTFYQTNALLGAALGNDPLNEQQAQEVVAKLTDDQKKTLVALGAKFSNLPAEDMAQVVRATRFYKNADEGIGLFTGQKFQGTTMPKVVDFCVGHGIVDNKPTVGFAEQGAQLNFDPQFMQKVKDK
jgi:NitT/TauT family transport system substrate-binding protein